jgi:hypothetical protein
MAITVDQDVHAKILRAAKAEQTSVSAWMTAAARHVLALRQGLAEVSAWEAEHGELTARELKAARLRVLGPGRGSRKRESESLKP